MTSTSPTIRFASPTDAPAIAAIYGHHVLHGFGTFEEDPPSDAEIANRMTAVLDAGHPYLVAVSDSRVRGFAYATQFRPRAAYRHSVEDSIYVAPEAIGQGVGRTLLNAVIAACETLGRRQMIAIIGDSGNAASIGLHAAFGFTRSGVGRSVGFKHGRWVDIVYMQRALNGGDESLPAHA